MKRQNEEFEYANVRILHPGVFNGCEGFVIKTANVSTDGTPVLVGIPEHDNKRVQFETKDLEITGYYA